MIAPKPIVNAGVGDAIDQVAVTPLLAAAVETEVTVPVPPLPLEAAVIRPSASTVILERV